jgi:hypothetical protein
MAAKGDGQQRPEAVVARRYWRPRMRRGRPHKREEGRIIEAEGTPPDETRKITFTEPFQAPSDRSMRTIEVMGDDCSKPRSLDNTLVPYRTRTGNTRPMLFDWSALWKHADGAPELAPSNASSTTLYGPEAYCRIAPDDHYGWEARWDRKLSTGSSARRVCLLKHNIFSRVLGLGGSIVPNFSPRSASLSDPEEKVPITGS